MKIAPAVFASTMLCGAVVAYAPAANALIEWDYCGDGGDSLTTGTTYVSSSSGTRWNVSKHQMTIGGNTAKENNLQAQLRHNTNAPVYWSWVRNNIEGNQTYAPTPNSEVPRASEMYTLGIFDQNGGDPRCYTLIQLDGIDQS